MGTEAPDWSARLGKRGVAWLCAGCAAAVAVLLFTPLRFMKWWAPEWKVPIAGAVHIAMWCTAVAVFWPLWRRGGRWRLAWVATALLALGTASEAIQPLFGRSAELRDVAFDVAGGMAAALALTGRWRTAAVLLALLFAAPFLDTAWLIRSERAAGLALQAPEERWSRWGWTGNGVKSERDDDETIVVRPSKKEWAEYPGLFRFVQRRDWRGTAGVRLQIWWPEEETGGALMGLRVDDRRDDPVYGERYQTEFRVAPGWNTVEIREGWLDTPSGGTLDRERIMKWGVFLIGAGEWTEWRLGRVELLEGGP